MKKVFLVLLLSVLCFGSSCKSSSALRSSLRHLAPYMHEISMADYIYDSEFVTLGGKLPAFGCFSVRNENSYGHGFGVLCANIPEFIVHVKANDSHLASIGVAMHLGLDEQALLSGKYGDEQLGLIPNFVLDGINERGVICSLDAVPCADAHEITGTNPGAEKLHMLFAPRFILDNATSANNAIKLLENRDIFGDMSHGYSVHIMIADAYRTYIVEFVDNKLLVMERRGDEQLMTNFYIAEEAWDDLMIGLESYDNLLNGYDGCASFEGMCILVGENPVDVSEWIQVMSAEDEEVVVESDTETESGMAELPDSAVSGDDDEGSNTLNVTMHSSVYSFSKRIIRVVAGDDFGNSFIRYL